MSPENTQIQKQAERIAKRVECIANRGKLIRQVLGCAADLAKSQPDKFGVRQGEGSRLPISVILAITEFQVLRPDAATIFSFRLSLSTITTPDGKKKSLFLKQRQCFLGQEPVSYRLDLVQDAQVEKLQRKILRYSEERRSPTAAAFAGCIFDQNSNGVSQILEAYPGTNIEPGEALQILQNATNLAKPADMPESLRDLRGKFDF